MMIYIELPIRNCILSRYNSEIEPQYFFLFANILIITNRKSSISITDGLGPLETSTGIFSRPLSFNYIIKFIKFVNLLI